MLDLDSLFCERDLARASARLAATEQFARTREGFLAGIDLAALEPKQRRAIRRDDADIAEALAFGRFYLIHLADLAAQAAALPLAA